MRTSRPASVQGAPLHDARDVVRKAVFPVAGFGTRFLPATKACPKELLPVVDRPLVQYAVDEAARAGITDIVFVTGRNKRAIEDHFDRAYELEAELNAKRNVAALEALASVLPRGVSFSYVRQPAMLGLGDAVLRARPLIGDAPFAVVLPDDLIDGTRPALGELLDLHYAHRASVVAVMPVAPADVDRYGIVATDHRDRILRIVEKPAPGMAPSNLGVVGRYVLTPGIWRALEALPPGAGGEIQLTDAIAALLATETVVAGRFNGRRYDCGSTLGFLEAQMAYARKNPVLWRDLRQAVAPMFRSGARNATAAMSTDADAGSAARAAAA